MTKADAQNIVRLSACALLVIGLAGATSASAADQAPPAGLEAASRAFDDAQFRQDPKALSGMMDPQMVYIRGSGALAGRAEFLGGFSDHAVVFDPFVIRDRHLVPLGADVWAVTGEGVITGSEAGKRFSEHFRYSDVFRHGEEGWRVVYVQVTRLP